MNNPANTLNTATNRSTNFIHFKRGRPGGAIASDFDWGVSRMAVYIKGAKMPPRPGCIRPLGARRGSGIRENSDCPSDMPWRQFSRIPLHKIGAPLTARPARSLLLNKSVPDTFPPRSFFEEKGLWE